MFFKGFIFVAVFICLASAVSIHNVVRRQADNCPDVLSCAAPCVLVPVLQGNGLCPSCFCFPVVPIDTSAIIQMLEPVIEMLTPLTEEQIQQMTQTFAETQRVYIEFTVGLINLSTTDIVQYTNSVMGLFQSATAQIVQLVQPLNQQVMQAFQAIIAQLCQFFPGMQELVDSPSLSTQPAK